MGTNKTLTPYDTGEALRPYAWHDVIRKMEDVDYGRVDFDSPEGGTEFTVQIVKNDPLPAGGEEYTIRIAPMTGATYTIEEIEE